MAQAQLSFHKFPRALLSDLPRLAYPWGNFWKSGSFLFHICINCEFTYLKFSKKQFSGQQMPSSGLSHSRGARLCPPKRSPRGPGGEKGVLMGRRGL